MRLLNSDFRNDSSATVDSWRDYDGALDSSMQTAITNYITALNNFQANGVIVQSNSNTTAEVDADIFAALPTFYSQLAEAWITVVNIEVDGASGSESYSLQSAPCGQTKTYCLGADGTQLTGVANGSSHTMHLIGSGTSYAAPQISGAVALLNEAFPNHTPEMIVDRLLATGQNSTSLIGSHTGAVTFGGIQHGYNANYGHGLMDVYAALNPITSSSYSQSSGVTPSEFSEGGGDDLNNSQSSSNEIPLKTKIINSVGQIIETETVTSYIATSQSLGDSLQSNLSSVQNYFYDALDGGFKYKLSMHVLDKVTKEPIANLEVDFNLLNKNVIQVEDKRFEFVEENSGVFFDTSNEDESSGIKATLFEPAVPVQNFVKDDNDQFLGFNNKDPYYLDTKDNGYSVGYRYQLNNNLAYSYGYEAPMQVTDDDFAGKNSMLAMSSEYRGDNYKHTLISGRMKEEGGFLDTEAKGIFAMDNLETNHDFFGIKSEFTVGDSLYIKGSYSSATSSLNYTHSPLIDHASDLVSDNFEIAIAKDFKDLGFKTVLSISQPNRIKSGTMQFNQPSLSTLQGDIYYDTKDVSLTPSGRQIDIGIGFAKTFNVDTQLITKFTIQDEYNHNKNSDTEFGVSLVGKFKDFKVGYMHNTYDSSSQIKLNYETKF